MSRRCAKPVPPADLWARMDEIHQQLVPRVKPPGAFTISDYMKRYGVTRSCADDRLRRAFKRGLLAPVGFWHKNWSEDGSRLVKSGPERLWAYAKEATEHVR